MGSYVHFFHLARASGMTSIGRVGRIGYNSERWKGERMKVRLRQWVKKSGTWGFFTLVRTVEFLAVLIALIAFFNEINYRHEERTARAWQLLTTEAPGNSGKGEALEYLNSRKIPLEGIDLTPPILAEEWKQIPIEERRVVGHCLQSTYLRKVELPKAILTNATLVCADLQQADLREANLRNADLRGADLRGAKLQGANLEAGMQRATPSYARLQGAALSHAKLSTSVYTDLREANLSDARLQGANLSDAGLQGANLVEAKLRGVTGIQCSELKQTANWTTADRDEELKCGEPIVRGPFLRR